MWEQCLAKAYPPHSSEPRVEEEYLAEGSTAVIPQSDPDREAAPVIDAALAPK